MSEKCSLWVEQYKRVATSLMERHGYRLLRISMGIVFIWFGLLKPLGMSPAEALVAKATAWIPIPGFIYVLTVWEVAIGVCFLFESLVGYALVLLFLHMPGTLLPLITLRDETFVRFPFALTLEGQYIIKNFVLIAAGMVLGGRLKPREVAASEPVELPRVAASPAPADSAPAAYLVTSGRKYFIAGEPHDNSLS